MKSYFRIDWLLLAPVMVLVTISLITIFSISPDLFRSQLFTLCVSLVAFLFFSRINIDFLKQMTVPIYFISLILLAILFIIGIESRGAVRWIDIFGVRLQFSEVLKPFLAIAFATFLTNGWYGRRKTFWMTLVLLLPVVLLITLQPDLGSGLIYAFVAGFALLVAGYPLLWFGLLMLPVVIASPFVWMILHDYQKQRVMTFLNPTADPLGTSYNSIQAIIAVGSGTFFGKGWLQGTQSTLRFLPEKHTDFIFATISEGLGFVGATFLVLTFAFLCYRIYVIYQNSHDRFTKIFAVCVFGFFLIQGFVNIGMNVGYLPIVGVTLPFVSFGGSSLLSNFIFLGLLSGMSIDQKKKHVLEIR
jgi:rod shape determining protein RodA